MDADAVSGPDADVRLVLAGYQAYARGDIDGAVAGLAATVEWIEPDEFPGGGRYVGPDAVADYLRGSLARWDTLSSTPTAHHVAGRIVVVHHVMGRTVDGVQRENTVADVFTVRAGKVVHMQAYADPAGAFAALGADPLQEASQRVSRPE
jgi:ketosteroid isomerase-like protein